LVRRDALERIAARQIVALAPAVEQHLPQESDPLARSQALRTLATLAPQKALPHLHIALGDAEPAVQRAAAVALSRLGTQAIAEAWLEQQAASALPAQRVLAALALGELPSGTGLPLLRGLLADKAPEVRKAAFGVLTRHKTSELWPLALKALHDPASHEAAADALVAAGAAVLPELQQAYHAGGQPERLAILAICGRIGGSASALPIAALDNPAEQIRQQAITALRQANYQASGATASVAQAQLRAEAALSAWLLAARRDIPTDGAFVPLQAALGRAAERSRERVLGLLGLLYDGATVQRAHENLTHHSSEQRAYAVEAIDLLLPRALKPIVLPLIEGANPLASLEKQVPLPRRTAPQWLAEIAAQPGLHPWLGTCARYAAGQSDETGRKLVERVVLLQNTVLFAAVPGEALVAVAQSLQACQHPPHNPIFHTGDPGDSLYLIEHGAVRIHTGPVTLSNLGPGELFGEAAAFDMAPRVASATTSAESTLLRLDRGVLYALIGDHTAVAHGIIRAMIGYVRRNVRRVSRE
jgi:HEAT repeat protein